MLHSPQCETAIPVSHLPLHTAEQEWPIHDPVGKDRMLGAGDATGDISQPPTLQGQQPPRAHPSLWRWSRLPGKVRARAADPPLTMSSAKLETPAPRADWVTQRYRSCSALDTPSSWKVARKRRWLMCFTEAAGTTSPLCLCPKDTPGVTQGVTWHRWSQQGCPPK